MALAASGLLNPEVGGRSVYPPLPAFLFQPPVSYGPKIWPEEKEPSAIAAGCTRSAIARFRIRCCRPSTLPTAISPASARARSNTPLQALMTLNEPVSWTAPAHWPGERWRRAGPRTRERLVYAFRRCCGATAHGR